MAITDLLANPLVSSEQIYRSQQVATAKWGEDASSIRFAEALLTQSAGVLLRLPQEVVATALVVLQRFHIHESTESGESFTPQALSAASIYLAAKLSFTPLSPRLVINVYSYLSSSASPLWFVNKKAAPESPDFEPYFVSEGTYEREKKDLFTCESVILGLTGYNVDVNLPHSLALTYLQALGVSRPSLAGRVFEYLNSGLLSPQLLYLTHQPNALAVAAIYLGARETGIKLVDGNWWEVFDVDREDLGFLVLAFGSLKNYGIAVQKDWAEMPSLSRRFS